MSNAKSPPAWFAWTVATVVLAAIGAGLWSGGMHYAHMKMGMSGMDQDGMSGMGMSGMSGMSGMGGMPMGNMGGMKMGPAGGEPTAAPSGVPGYAELRVSTELQQRIGVKTGEVEQAPLTMSIRTVGIVQSNETQVEHVHLKTEGWIEKLFVNYTGQKVEKGDPLLAIYSPDFLSTQREYLTARRAASSGSPTLTAAQESLADAARRRLELWDVPADEIEALEKTGAPQKSLIMRSKLNGTVLMKDAYEGHRVTPDRELFVIADLSTVWVQSKVFEYELPHVELGRPATVRVPSLPGQEFIGKVDFIGPTLDEATRTVRVRVELANPEGAFKPGMFLNIEIQHEMGEGLLAPTSAVTRTGERDIAFRVESGDEHGDRIVPVEVKLDTIKFGDRFHIVEGLEAGDKVVTSANFLIDSESRLHSGGGDSAGMGGMNMGGMQMDGMKGMDHSKMKGMDHSKMKGMDDSKMKGMDHSKMKH